LGDLSGKHGWLAIRSADSDQETTVVTDSNLPLTGPYTSEPNIISNVLLFNFLFSFRAFHRNTL